MKRIVAAVILLLLSITTAFISNFYVIKKIDGVSHALSELVERMNDLNEETIEAETEKIVAEWKKDEWLFHSFVASDLIIEAERSLEILPELAKYEVNDEFRVHCINAYNLIHTIYESEKISKENIF